MSAPPESLSGRTSGLRQTTTWPAGDQMSGKHQNRTALAEVVCRICARSRHEIYGFYEVATWQMPGSAFMIATSTTLAVRAQSGRSWLRSTVVNSTREIGDGARPALRACFRRERSIDSNS